MMDVLTSVPVTPEPKARVQTPLEAEQDKFDFG